MLLFLWSCTLSVNEAALNNPLSIDDDGDGFSEFDGDCDDRNPTTYPGAAHLDSALECMRDVDGDGYGDSQVSGEIVAGSDCDDTDSQSTTVLEDQDCDATVSLEDCDDQDSESTIIAEDADCDGVVTAADCDDSNPDSTIVSEDGDCDGVLTTADCDDADAALLDQAGDEDCDGVLTAADCDDLDAGSTVAAEDQDCDGFRSDQDCVDNDAQVFPGAALAEPALCTRDLDGDGFGDSQLMSPAQAGSDCDDTDALVYPDADEYCDGHDDDCDGLVDEAGSINASTWYLDQDGDGYGQAGNSLVHCAQPLGYSLSFGDCEDGDSSTFPGAAFAESAIGCMTDADGDGWGAAAPIGSAMAGSDCDDSNAGLNLDDSDGDSYSTCDGDCDDSDAALSPISQWYLDNDQDGYGDAAVSVIQCECPSDYVAVTGDCNDSVAALNGADLDGDGYSTCDGDCDDSSVGLNLDDLDGDGYSTCDSDCDDADASLSPGIDADGDQSNSCEDCDDADNSVDARDVDGDGYSTCDGDCDDWDYSLDLDDWDGDGYSTCDGDCEDWDAALAPTDSDGDGYSSCDGDCDDSDAGINPAALEINGDGIDQDCDGDDPPIVCYFELTTSGSNWCSDSYCHYPNKVIASFTGIAPFSQHTSSIVTWVPYGSSTYTEWFTAESGTRVRLYYTGTGGGNARLRIHDYYNSNSGTSLSYQTFSSSQWGSNGSSSFVSGWLYYDDYPTCN